MDPENKIKECILNFENRLKGGRLLLKQLESAIESLKECLENKAVVSYLDGTSKKGSNNKGCGYTWQDVFKVCHNNLLRNDLEAEDEERRGVSATRQKQEARESSLNLVGFVAQKANKDPARPYLEQHPTVNTCLEVLKNERNYRQSKQIGALYLNILYKHIMSLRPYWCEISADHWKGIVDYCMDVYKIVSIAEKTTLIKVLEICVSKGCAYSPLALVLKKRFDFFEQMFEVQDLLKQIELEESLLKLCNTVTEVLALECRMALCKLGENTFRCVIRMRRTKVENDKRMTLLYNFLLLQMSLHHPGGVEKGKGAYAHDWNLWHKHLLALHNFIQEEVQAAFQPRSNIRHKLRGLDSQLSPAVIKLAVQVWKHTFNMHSTHELYTSCLDDTLLEGAAKRRKIETVGVSDLIDELKQAKQSEEIATRLQLICELSKCYPKMFTSAEHLLLLQVLIQIQSSRKNIGVLKHLCRCYESLLAAETCIDMDSADKTTSSQLWDRIWDMTLRSVGLNQVEEGNHSLLQALLCSPWCQPERYSSLLELLLSRSVRLSLSSVKTLATLAEKCHLPSVREKSQMNSSQSIAQSQIQDQTTCIWETLLKWLLPSKTEEEAKSEDIPSEILADTLVCLLLKTKVHPIQKSAKKSTQNDILSKIEATYKLTALESGIIGREKHNIVVQPSASVTSVAINTTAQDVLFQLLSNEYNAVREKFESESENSKISDKVATINLIIYNMSIFGHILSYMIKWKMIKENEIQHCSIKQYLEELVTILPIAIMRAFKVQLHSASKYHLEVLENLKQLYTENYHKNVACLLRQQNSIDTVKLLSTIAKSITKSLKKADSFGGDFTDTDMSSAEREQEYSGSLADSSNKPTVSPYLCIKDTSSLFNEHGFPIEVKKHILATQVLTKFWFIENGSSWSSTDDDIDDILSFAHELSGKIPPELSKIDIQKIVYIIHHASLSSSLSAIQVFFIMEVLKNLAKSMCKDQEIVLVVLSVLYNMLQHVHKDEIAGNKNTATAIINGFTKIINKQVFGSTVRVSLIKCLGKVAEVDPEQTWLLKKAENGHIPIAIDIVEYLKDPYNEARISAAHSIKTIFCADTPGWDLSQTHKWHRYVFEQMCKTVTMSFDNVATQDEDELINLTTSALQSMGVVILTNPQWRKKAIFGIIQQAKLQKMDISALKNMLEIVGKELKVPSIKQFLGANLTFILTQWLKMYKLEEFPWTLLECRSELDFLSSFQQIIVPIVIQSKNTDSLKYITEKINKTENEVVEQCYSKIISCILPYMESVCDKSNLQLRSSDAQTAKVLHDEILAILGDDKLDELLNDHLQDIVVCLFHQLHDPIKWQEKVTTEIPLEFTEPDSPVYDLALVEYSLLHVQSISPEPGIPLLEFLAQESPRRIQIILQQLAVSIHDAPTQEDRLRAFLQYSAFTEILSSHLEGGNIGKVTAFAVRDIVYMLLNLLKSSKDDEQPVFVLVCMTLQDICSKCIKYCLKYFKDLLPIITNTLVMTVKKHNCGPVGLKALSVLEFLIVENQDTLKPLIEKMDPFPRDEIFSNIQSCHQEIKYGMNNYDLEAEIEHFLNVGKAGEGNRVEGLIHMRSQLACKKTELKMLYKELHSLRGFSEDCASSLLHQLICVLVKLASDSDKSISLEAAKCLGELGPSHLSSLVLQPENTSLTCEDSPPQVALCKKKIELLKDYLVDSDRSVAAGAAAALYSLLQTKEGQHALKAFDDHEYLEPFKCKIKQQLLLITIDEEQFKQKINDDELWCPTLPYLHETWITELVCTILQTMSYSKLYLNQLIDVCKAKVEFSVELLPFLVNCVLSCGIDECKSLVVKKINLIFTRHYSMRHKSNKSNLICFNKTSVQCMLNVVQFIRTQEHGLQGAPRPSQLNLNFLHVAQAAQFCSAYFTSLLYAELWGTQHKRRTDNPSAGFRTIDEICDNSEDGKALHTILLQGYKKIGDPDALYGCGMSRLLDPQSRIWYYEHCNQWDKVMLMHDIVPNQTKGVISRGAAFALQQSGLHHMLESYLQHQQTEEMKALQYECCWRLGRWDAPTTAEAGKDHIKWTTEASTAYEAYHYSALKSLYTSDVTSLDIDITNSRNCITQSLTHANLESSKNIYSALSQLQSLQELEDFSQILRPIPEESSHQNRTILNKVLKKWKDQDEITCNHFQYCEPILSQRIALLGIACERQDSQEVLHAELHDGTLVHATSKLLLQLAQTARNEKWFHVSEKALRQVTKLQDLDDEFTTCWKLEDSRNLWDQGNKDMGRHSLLSLITSLNESDLETHLAGKLEAEALGLYGTWLVDSRSENAQTIINEYFMKAINVLESVSHSNNSELVEAYRSLARFADMEYQRVDKYMKSPIFVSRKQCMEKSKEAALTLRKEQSQTKDVARAININDKQSKLDLFEIETMTKERQKYLELALEYYLQSLYKSTADEEESTVFRIVSLWLDNKSNLGNSQQFLEGKLKSIESYKFLAVVPQLVPHITNSKDKFDVMLTELLERLSLDHPHHVLPTLLALAELNKDVQYMEKDSCPPPQTPESRVTAAQALIRKLKRQAKLTEVISQMESNLNALVELAYYIHPQKSLQGTKIPSKLRIVKLKDLNKMQVPTLNLPVNRTGQYNNITGIHSYEKEFFLVGGITAPKKITCIGTDGSKRTQLLKGLDDLHQDAVMQQVFTIMNKLLRHNKKTQERKLLVRTYKVIPLSQRSGIIEWCGNTQPIGGYLLKAHPRYHPNDLPPNSCRAKLEQVQRDSVEKRLRVYLEVCQKLTPVFHHFFTENFLLPGVWFEKRVAYTRSIATNSMIGYILGLGDRHVQNILVDQKTAEVIHIDFGIAFEQGLVLTVPETVPFRLTRDIEDGLGISGVEGVFRKSCEKTMEVLRENQETILTILQVLLYDPLYVWAISPERNQNDRKGIKGSRGATTSAVEVNKIAERALLRLQQKLLGTEEGTATSVEGQVNRLIQQARDPTNLCRLFYGWQPYL